MELQWCRKTKRQYTLLNTTFTSVMSCESYIKNDAYFCCEVSIRETLAALSVVRIDAKESRLVLMYTLVLESYRGMGINGRIKAFVEAFAREKNLSSILGHVRLSNRASQHSLLKSGYEIYDEGGLTYGDGERKLTVRKFLH